MINGFTNTISLSGSRSKYCKHCNTSKSWLRTLCIVHLPFFFKFMMSKVGYFAPSKMAKIILSIQHSLYETQGWFIRLLYGVLAILSAIGSKLLITVVYKDETFSYDVAVIQWITSCHKNRRTTRVITLCA